MHTTRNVRRAGRVASLACAVGALFVAKAASAASMQKVDQATWWAGVTGLPSYVNMYIYVPDAPAAKPPIVVVPHHCQGSASSTNSEIASLYTVANQTGFIVIIPEATGENCWDAGSTRSLKHGGLGDTGAIVQMVKYTLAKYSGDANRVYTVGGSSGGIMTEALLGVYPDVFMAGVSLMGVPCGCWADQYHDVTGNPSDGTGQWSGPCAGGTVTKTGQQWGDLVRSYFPGYMGHRPRLQHWHGTADTTLNYKVMAEDIKEWTNLLGLSETPTSTDMPKSGTTHQAWKNSCGFTVYETFALSGVGHAVPFDGAAIAAYFGLDKAGGQDPETAACPGAVPGGGTNGAGGATGSGGATGAGGRGGAPAGGSGGASGGHGGVSGTGGAMMTSSGGSNGSGGVIATGGSMASGSGGSTSGSGGVTATGGTTTAGSGGLTGSGGSVIAASGGTSASSGGRTGSGGSSSSGSGGVTSSGGNGVGENGDSGAGCSCDTGAGNGGSGQRSLVLLGAALAITALRTRRRAARGGDRRAA